MISLIVYGPKKMCTRGNVSYYLVDDDPCGLLLRSLDISQASHLLLIACYLARRALLLNSVASALDLRLISLCLDIHLLYSVSLCVEAP